MWQRHRHTPEIEEQLGYAAGKNVTVTFTPHLVPMNRGILATEYASLDKGGCDAYEEVKAAYDKYYKKEKFVRVLPKGCLPGDKMGRRQQLCGCRILRSIREPDRMIMMGALDNLVKGAAGQAVQNMNLLFGFDEAEGYRSGTDVPVKK